MLDTDLRKHCLHLASPAQEGGIFKLAQLAGGTDG